MCIAPLSLLVCGSKSQNHVRTTGNPKQAIIHFFLSGEFGTNECKKFILTSGNIFYNFHSIFVSDAFLKFSTNIQLDSRSKRLDFNGLRLKVKVTLTSWPSDSFEHDISGTLSEISSNWAQMFSWSGIKCQGHCDPLN